MGLLDIFRKKGLNPNQSNNNFLARPVGAVLQQWENGKYVSEGYLANADVYAIVNFLARKCASLPWYVYKVKPTSKARDEHRRYKHLSKGINMSGAYEAAMISRKNAYEENIVMDSPLARLLERPNSYQGQDQFFQNLFGFRVLSGEGNIYLNTGGVNGGKVLEMNVLPTQFLEIYPDPNDLYGILGYRLMVDKGTDIDKSQVIAWKSWNPDFNSTTRSHLRGISPIRAAYKTLRMSNSAADASASMALNGGAKGAFSPKIINGVAASVNENQAADIQRIVNQNINGTDNKGKISILQTPWDYTNLGLSSIDMELIESMNYTLHQWCRVFGLPGVIFDTSVSSYNNYQNAMRDLMTNTIVPLACELRDELNKYLPKAFGENVYIDFDITALPELQQDMERMSRILRDANWLTMDEKRVAMNYERKGGAFDHAYVNQGLITLEQVMMDLSISDDNSNDNGQRDLDDSDDEISEDSNGVDVSNGEGNEDAS
jgi:HK97 family phage portal protein